MSERLKKTKDDSGRLRIQIKQRLTSFADPLQYKIVDEKEVNFTQARAYEFLELNEFPGERKVRQNHVQFLYDELISGRFLWHNVNLAIARIGKDLGPATKYYRINGQHTAWMRVSVPANKEPIKAECTQRTYEVEDEQQLRNLYACFDRGAPRTVGHVSQVLLMGTQSANGLTPTVIRRLIPGFRMFWSVDWQTANVNPNDIVGIVENSHSRLFNTVGHFVQIHQKENYNCHRAAVIGSMFATFEKAVQASDEFWTPVWSGLHMTKKSDARYRLREFIDNHGHAISAAGRVSTWSKISPEDLYRCCVNTWNRWRKGEDVDTVRTSKERSKVSA